MKLKKLLGAVIGFLGLSFFLISLNLIDLAILYSIFLYFQFLLAPLLTGIGFFFYILRLSLPYICMYILVCLFFNFQSYKINSTIKLLKYTIDINAVRKSKIYIYIRQYSYALIIVFNLFLLCIVYYAYINNKFIYLLFIFIFYLSIGVVIKIKHGLFKNQALQYKKVHMLVNIILVVLIGTYISMTLEEFHLSNVKVFGLENFGKLIENKYFLKMPSKDFNGSRLFNGSKQTSSDRYMLALKKGLVKTSFLDKKTDIDLYNDNLSSQSNKNEEINLNSNSKLSDFLNKTKYEDQNLSRFTNALYQKFKKIFLLQTHIKSYNFLPTPEMVERQKLLNGLKNPYNFIDLSKYYTSAQTDDSTLYNNYLDLVDKKFNNLTTKKVFLITLHKNHFSLKNITFYADFEHSYKKNYVIFLNSEQNIDLKNSSMLDFEYYNSAGYCNFEFNDLWLQIQNELYIVLQENNEALSLFSVKFKNLYTIKKFTFSFREHVLDDSDKEILSNIRPKAKNYIMIPDFKKLQVGKTFKLNYKEIIYNHTLESKKIKFFNSENYGLDKNKQLIPITQNTQSEIYFVFEDDIAYSLSDNKLTQVEDLTFDELNLNQEYDMLSEFIVYYLENIKGKNFSFIKKFIKINNDIEKAILEFSSYRVHEPTFNNMYHEILFQNSNKLFKYIIENYAFSRDLLTCSRSLMTFEMGCIAMQKLLNLNTESFCLNNLKDFSDFCKSDFTEDLEFNFSLAFDIMQNKYDINKFFSIPDLEGIPGTFYEYTVKYNYHMNKMLWYEEQEELIDGVYDISYYSLVNIMDTVKDVDYRENDFLYDMINKYLSEVKYKGAAELYDKGLTEKPTKQLILLNKKLTALNDIHEIHDIKEVIKFMDPNVKHIPGLHNKSLCNFDNIKTLEELNYKIELDINVMHKLFKGQMYQIVKSYPGLVEDFTTLHHDDFHDAEFELLDKFYSQAQEEFSWDLGVLGGVGLHSDHFFYVPHDEYLDDTFELKNYERLNFFYEEIDSIMFSEYTQLLETEEFDNGLVEEHYDLHDQVKYFVLCYKEEVQLARIKIINKMLYDSDVKRFELFKYAAERVYSEPNELNLEFEKLKCLEFRNIELAKIPIYDGATYTFIDENVELLLKENENILFKKLDEVEMLMDRKNAKLLEMKKASKLYYKQIIKHKMEEPATKRFLDKDGDDYNYFSNKSDKLMKDGYKTGKKK